VIKLDFQTVVTPRKQFPPKPNRKKERKQERKKERKTDLSMLIGCGNPN